VTRINFILLLALLVSGLYLVRSAHDVRRLFAELDKARALENQLEADHGRLSAEMQSQATPLKIEKAAREKLHMRTATVAVTHYVTYSSVSEFAP
jgi:cell division protein FtsL